MPGEQAEPFFDVDQVITSENRIFISDLVLMTDQIRPSCFFLDRKGTVLKDFDLVFLSHVCHLTTRSHPLVVPCCYIYIPYMETTEHKNITLLEIRHGFESRILLCSATGDTVASFS
jgi:hypothetical protein